VPHHLHQLTSFLWRQHARLAKISGHLHRKRGRQASETAEAWQSEQQRRQNIGSRQGSGRQRQRRAKASVAAAAVSVVYPDPTSATCSYGCLPCPTCLVTCLALPCLCRLGIRSGGGQTAAGMTARRPVAVGVAVARRGGNGQPGCLCGGWRQPGEARSLAGNLVGLTRWRMQPKTAMMKMA